MATHTDDTLPAPDVARAADGFAAGSQIAGRYRIEKLLGTGGMGEVYAAEDLIVGGKVALKTLRPELAGSATAIERFRREIALARKVTSPHVCRVHDVGEHTGRLFITMELLEGTTLAERGRPVSIAELDRLAHELVAGLAALHAAGIVHRDFKPSNVIVVGERAVITDFGLARSTTDTEQSLTAEATLLGTPAYMAPEQVEARTATTASDVYALGVVLFELATGKLPFAEDTAMATATARLHKDPPVPSSLRSELPARWDLAIARCLARDPEARFSRVEDVLGPVATSRRRLFAIGGALAIAGAIGVALALRTSGDPNEVAAVECPSAIEKLVGVWDPITRAEGAGRFLTSGRPYVRDVWDAHAAQFDAHASAWATRWDAACAAPDRATDPMLYGQRLACLDANLVELRGYAVGFVRPVVSVEDVALGSPGQFPINPPSECDHEGLLRAQPPPPPIGVRDEARAILVESHRLRAQLRLRGAGVEVDTSGAFDGLAALSQKARAIGFPAGAGDIDGWRAMFLAGFQRVPEAEKVIEEMIDLGERTRDDTLTISGLVSRVQLRTFQASSYDAVAGAAALDTASRMAERIGSPDSVVERIVEARVAHERRVRSYSGLIAAMRQLAELDAKLQFPSHALWTRSELVRLRARHGDPDVTEAAAILHERERLTGPDNMLLATDLIELAVVFERAGDIATAYAHTRRGLALLEPAKGRLSQWHVPGTQRAFAYALALGKLAEADAHLDRATALATPGEIATALLRRGHLAAARRVLDRNSGLAAVRAELALADGDGLDRDWPAELATLPQPERDRSLAMLDARAKRRVSALARTDAVPDPVRALVRGRVLQELGDRGAISQLRAAREQLDFKTRDYKLATAWLGLALLDANDPAGAITLLEEALWIVDDAVLLEDVRFALARAFVARDPKRARGHAITARSAFARMGLSERVHSTDAFVTRIP